jgi:uncharacterized protein YcbK (DUF882 family)
LIGRGRVGIVGGAMAGGGSLDRARGRAWLASSRRELLRAAALAIAALALGPRGAALGPRASALAAEPRRLRLLHTHTGERLDVTYFDGAAHVPDALAALDRFLRDFRTGEVHPIDPAVLDVAWRMARDAGGAAATFEIVSGYRSPRTNERLRRASGGVARRSLHLVGKALDLRLQGVPTIRLRAAALALRAGGVGFYPGRDFVHVDTGPVRAW